MKPSVRTNVADGRLVDRIAYQPELDGIRALAAMAVFAVHLDQNSDITGSIGPLSIHQLCVSGRHGVAVFLLLTGYLLAAPLWRYPVQERGAHALRQYWRRRAGKVLPLYFLVLVCFAIVQRPWDDNEDVKQYVLHALLIHNFSETSLYSISAPLWAMAIIVQYYVFFGALFGVLRSCKMLSTPWLVVTFGFMLLPLWGINFLIDRWVESSGHVSTILWQHSLLIHLPIFALGAVLAAFGQYRPPTQAKTWIWDVLGVGSALVSLVLLASPLVGEVQWSGARYGYPLIPGLLAMVILAATRQGLVGRALSVRPLVFLGTISYAFYLSHLPIIGLTRKAIATLSGDSSSAMLLGALSFAATTVCAWAATRLVEFPLRSRLMMVKAEASPGG